MQVWIVLVLSSSSLVSCRLHCEKCLSAVHSRGAAFQSNVVAVLRVIVWSDPAWTG